jgi:hypothetical protein
MSQKATVFGGVKYLRKKQGSHTFAVEIIEELK